MKKRVPTEKEISKTHGVSLDYVTRQAEIGSTVEREHTTSHEEAYGIALQHIAEFPDYYKHLLKMEKKLKTQWKNGKKSVKEEKEEIRYCDLCKKEETKSECSYGPSAWEMNTRLLKMQEDHKEIASGKKLDDEGYMANLELDQMERSIAMLRKVVRKSNQQLPAWVQSKITRAADFVDTAAEYLSSDEKLSEGFKQADYVKMKRKEDKHVKDAHAQGPDPQELSGKYRSKSRNRASKMSDIRDAMMRGEDPRRDTRGGAFAKKGNPNVDHRASYTYNQSFMPNYKKRRIKKAGVGETQDVKEAKVDDRLSADQKQVIRNRRLSPGDRLPVRGETPRDTEQRLTQTRRNRTASSRGAQGVKGSKVPDFSGVKWQRPEQRSRRRDELRAKRAKNNIRSFKEGKTFEQFIIEARSVNFSNFEIGAGHKKAQRDAKIRNLADRTSSAGEASVAKSKLTGPEWKKPKLKTEGAAWTKKSGKSPSGGLNEKGRKSYERENPGSDLKPPQPKGGPRKNSFCARMGGMPGPMKDEKGRPTRKALALRKWNC